ncbi:MAG: hypothetical protein CMJ83_18215 [Planctomycetes bacterium]|nr:hypothetical protein [Planctomycetota bacterium]
MTGSDHAGDAPDANASEQPGGRTSPTERDSRLEELLSAFILEQEEGKHPQIEDWMTRHPTYAEDLAVLLSDPSAPRPLSTECDEDTLGFDAPAPEPVRRIGPWEILEKVATGGGGTVYRARHDDDRHVVALKVMDEVAYADARDFERFEREARMVQNMDLVNVVPVEGMGASDGRRWIAMKWIEGSTLGGLSEQIADGDEDPRVKRLRPMQERARLLARVARTFEAVHGYGILHRDIKPSNILIDRLGEPMIIDFGIAQAPELGELTMTGDGLMGTPRYLAPELLEGGNTEVTRQTDIYGLGLCLYEIATGTRAFVQRTRSDLFTQIRMTGPLDPRRACEGVPHALSAIILRAMAIKPHRRYPTMSAFADDLERFARGALPDSVTLRSAAPWRRFLMRRWRGVAAAAAVVVALLGALPFVLDHFAEKEQKELARRNLEELRAEVSPWFLAPREIGPRGDVGLDAAARELVQAAPQDLDARMRAAWIPFLNGRHEHAMSLLGPASAEESDALGLFRAWLELRLDWNVKGERIDNAIHSMNTGDVMDVMDVGRQDDWSPTAEVVRFRLRPPPGRAVATLLEDWDYEADEVDVNFLHVRAYLRYLSIPTGFTDAKRRRAGIRPCRADLEAVLKREPGRSWARYLLASLLLRHVDPKLARPHLEHLAKELPDNAGVAYLRGLSQLLKGTGDGPDDRDDGLASTEFERARSLLAKWRARCERVSGDTAFEDQLERKLHGFTVVLEIKRGRWSAALAAVNRWKDAHGGPYWQDRLLPVLFEARIAAAQELTDKVHALHQQAETIAGARALVPLEAARYARTVEKDLERAATLVKAARDRNRYRHPAPTSLESWLMAGWFGARPYARGVGFVSHIERPPPKNR